MEKILVIEDDENILNIILFNLEKNGYEVLKATDGKTAINLFENNKVDLILADVMLPRLSGFDVLKKVRSKSDVPFIIVSAKSDDKDKIFALDNMADDYITKPFSMSELLARVKVNIARYKNKILDDIEFKNIKINKISRKVFKGENKINLTNNEFSLLIFLIENKNKIFSRDELLNKVWQYEYEGQSARLVDVAIRRLREKIEDDPSNPKIIQSKRSVGYFCSDEDNKL